MNRLSSWWGAGPTFLVLVAVTVSCSSNKENDDDEPKLDWKCWANTANGTCECRGYGPNETGERAGTDIEDAEDCNGRAVCYSYFNDRIENAECACGDASFVPMDEDFSDVSMAESCPPE